MAKLTLEGITKVFPGGVKALDGLSLEAGERELLAVVGPSGCGKSTLLRIIAGLEDETEGRILLDGRELNGLPPKDRDMAIMFQSYTLFPHLTVEENMAFGLKLRKTPAADAKSQVAAIAATLGIGDLLHRRPSELSGGQRQRAALGRAILRKPSLYLFDEPLSNLDAMMRAQLRVEISRLHQESGSTMVFVTHDQVEAMTLGDRVAVLKDGVLQQLADPTTLYEKPANTFVAGFIGSPGMNLFPGTIGTWAADDTGDRTGSFAVNALASGDAPAFLGHALSAPLPPAWLRTLSAWQGRDILLGIRPEDIGPQAAPGAAAEGAPRLTGRVEVVERMGGQACLHVRTGLLPHKSPTPLFAARVDAAGWKAGQKVELPVSLAKAAFFDPATGKALSP
jgi:multiple sugar transport system ATP-binding protein